MAIIFKENVKTLNLFIFNIRKCWESKWGYLVIIELKYIEKSKTEKKNVEVSPGVTGEAREWM